MGRLHIGRGVLAQVIAMHAYINGTDGHGMAPNAFQYRGQPPCQVNSPCLDADDNNSFRLVIAFGDFVSDASEHSMHCGLV